MPLPRLVQSWKTIANAAEWTKPDPDDGYVRYSVPLDIEGITEAGLTLSGGAYARCPDRHVTFEMAVAGVNGPRRTRLARVDWRSLKGGHSNPRGKCPGPWDGMRVPETHYHSFELNWVESERRMKKGRLPCAMPISESPQTFEALRAFVGLHFRINNIGIVFPPGWEYDLFL